MYAKSARSCRNYGGEETERCLTPSLSAEAGTFWTAGRHDQQSFDPACAPSRRHRTDLVHRVTDQREIPKKGRTRSTHSCYVICTSSEKSWWSKTVISDMIQTTQRALIFNQNELGRTVRKAIRWIKSAALHFDKQEWFGLVRIMQAYRSKPVTKLSTEKKEKTHKIQNLAQHVQLDRHRRRNLT